MIAILECMYLQLAQRNVPWVSESVGVYIMKNVYKISVSTYFIDIDVC